MKTISPLGQVFLWFFALGVSLAMIRPFWGSPLILLALASTAVTLAGSMRAVVGRASRLDNLFTMLGFLLFFLAITAGIVLCSALRWE
jgi:hypothetical protein